MSFSYGAVWEDTMALARAHAPLLTAIAGVFMFLPALLFAVYLKPPEPQSPDINQMMRELMNWYAQAAPWLLLQGLISLVGSAAMLRLVFARGVTVGGALLFGLTLLPFYVLMSLLTSLMVGIGLGYLAGRHAKSPSLSRPIRDRKRFPRCFPRCCIKLLIRPSSVWPWSWTALTRPKLFTGRFSNPAGNPHRFP